MTAIRRGKGREKRIEAKWRKGGKVSLYLHMSRWIAQSFLDRSSIWCGASTDLSGLMQASKHPMCSFVVELRGARLTPRNVDVLDA